MSRTLLVLLALAAGGCGQAQEAAAPPPSSTATTTTTSSPAPPTAADGTNYAACEDGTCEVFVTGTVTIPLDPKFGFTEFVVTRTPNLLTIFGGDPVNGNLRATIGGDGQLKSNGIFMEVKNSDAAEDSALIKLSPRTD